MEVNTHLLEETLAHIQLNPELHDPEYFFKWTEFGMAACFAGRALILAGNQPRLFDGQHGGSVTTPAGEHQGAWSAAQSLLGIDGRWAASLFSPINTRKMLELKVKDLLNGEPVNHYGELVNK